MSEQAYLDLVQNILYNGVQKPDRTGTGTYSLFAERLQFDLDRYTMPLLTTKKVHWPSVAHEVIWFLRGEGNTNYLNENGVTIWDEWATDGDLGRVYGVQWRNWVHRDLYFDPESIDQIANVIKGLKEDPDSRRHIVSAWNVGELDEMALPPCHMMFQFYVDDLNQLHCHMYQRSADVFLGVPFNIAGYSLLTHMIAHCTGRVAKSLTISFGDVHLYKNHVNQALEQLRRTPTEFPTLHISRTITNIDEVTFEDLQVHGYRPHPAIKAEVAV